MNRKKGKHILSLPEHTWSSAGMSLESVGPVFESPALLFLTLSPFHKLFRAWDLWQVMAAVVVAVLISQGCF